MQKISLHIFLLLLMVLISCNKNKDKISNLVVEKSVDSFNITDNEQFFITSIADIVEADSSIIIVCRQQLSIVIVDFDLNLKKYISFENHSYLFVGDIKSAAFKNENLYLIDNSYEIKKLNLRTLRFSSINYLNNRKLPFYIRNIVFLDDSTFVGSTSDLVVEAVNPLILGAKFSLNGTLINEYQIDTDLLEYNDFIKNKYFDEKVYVNKKNKKLLFNFQTSKKCVQSNFGGEILNVFELNVDDKSYIEPYKDNKMGSYIHSVTSHQLEIDNNNIFQITSRSPRKGALIFEYDDSFNIINSFSLDYEQVIYRLGMRKIKNHIYFFDDVNTNIYKAVINNKN